MDRGTVEECLLRQSEIGDRVPVAKAFDVRPILFGVDRPALGCTQCRLTVECLREDLVEITLVTGDRGAVGESDSDRRHFRCRTRRLDEGRSEEHTSELQSHSDLVCRLLLEKKKKNKN